MRSLVACFAEWQVRLSVYICTQIPAKVRPLLLLPAPPTDISSVLKQPKPPGTQKKPPRGDAQLERLAARRVQHPILIISKPPLLSIPSRFLRLLLQRLVILLRLVAPPSTVRCVARVSRVSSSSASIPSTPSLVARPFARSASTSTAPRLHLSLASRAGLRRVSLDGRDGGDRARMARIVQTPRPTPKPERRWESEEPPPPAPPPLPAPPPPSPFDA